MFRSLTVSQRVFLTLACFAVAIAGFMLKLPSGFRHIDKELHAAFYFLAAAFLNLLFAKRNLIRHAAIFFVLYVFGIVIEYSQAYSNQFFRKRIHGRFDPEDVQSNVKGLIAFSLLWLIYTAAMLMYTRVRNNGKAYPANDRQSDQNLSGRRGLKR